MLKLHKTQKNQATDIERPEGESNMYTNETDIVMGLKDLEDISVTDDIVSVFEEQQKQLSVPPLPKADMETLKQTIAVYQEPNGVFEMRTLPNQGGKNVHCFVKNNEEGIQILISELNHQNLTEIPLYMTLQHVKQDIEKIQNINNIVQSKGNDCIKDENVDRYRFIHIDCDPERKPNEQGTTVQADDDEVEQAGLKVEEVKKFLADRGWAEPIEAFSGNGYTLDYAVDMEANKENKELVQKLLKALSSKFNDESVKIDTSVYNPARIIKLYGCVSSKGKHTADRPYRVTKLLHVPENRKFVTEEQVQSLICELDVKPEKKKSAKNSKTNSDKGKCAKIANVVTWLDHYSIEYEFAEETKEGENRKKFILHDCPTGNHPDDSQKSELYQYPNGNVVFHCFHDHCQGYTISDMLEKYPLVGQLPLLQGDDKKIKIYNAVISGCQLIVAQDNQHYVLTPDEHLLRLDTELLDEYITATAQKQGELISQNMVATIKSNIASLYRNYAQRADVATRIAFKDGRLYYALSEEKVLCVTENDIKECKQSDSDLYFYYGDAYQTQCEPDLKVPALELPKLVKQTFNVSDEFLLTFLAQLVCFFIPIINTPILVLSGGMGTSKSVTSRKIKQLVEPAIVDIQTMPEKEDGVYAALSGSYLVCFDNIDKIGSRYSDLFCIACTGGYTTKRKLFTDNTQVQIQLHTKIILNGIGDVVTKGDLAERTNIIYLDAISQRKTEKQVWEEFNESKPKLLGAIFNCIKDGLRDVGEMETAIKKLPRMADFCVYGAAFIKAMGLKWEDFVKQYTSSTNGLISEQAQLDDFVILIHTFLNENKNYWSGQAKNLLPALKVMADKKHLVMEQFTPSTLSRKLNQMQVSLQAVGIKVTAKHSTQRTIILEQEADTPIPSTPEENAKKLLDSLGDIDEPDIDLDDLD